MGYPNIYSVPKFNKKTFSQLTHKVIRQPLAAGQDEPGRHSSLQWDYYTTIGSRLQV